MTEPGHIVNGCYKLQEKVGEDRFFATWRATALYSPSNFSLTFLTFPYDAVPGTVFDEFRSLFLALYTFQNPYVLTPFEYEESGEVKYLASHWLEGYSLREAIDGGDFSEKDQVINTSIHLLHGLAELERIGVRHNALTPKSLLLTKVDAEYDIPRIRNIGFSLFLDALGVESEYRDLPGYRKESLRGGQSHERDLYAAGAIIAELVSVVQQTVPARELATLHEIAGSFCGDPGSFTSIADALTQVLTLYPEKRTVDLIQEHSADTSDADTMTTDLYHSIKARYEATRQETYELQRRGSDSPSPRRKRAAAGPAPTPIEGDSSEGDGVQEEAVEEEIAADAEVVELLPPAPDDRPKGLFARAASALRRMFSRRGGGRRRGAAAGDGRRHGAPAGDGGAADAAVEPPHRRDTDAEGGSAEGYRTVEVDNTEPVVHFNNAYTPGEVDTSRVLEIFRKLRDHFIGTTHREPRESRRVSRSRGTQKPPPWHGALDGRGRIGKRDADGDSSRGVAHRSDVHREHDGGEESLPDGMTGARNERGRADIDREADGATKEYDFKNGPEYAPGERLGLDDEVGEHRDVDFGDSSVRTDRGEPDGSGSARSHKGTPPRSKGAKGKRKAPIRADDNVDAHGGPAVSEGATTRGDASNVEGDADAGARQSSDGVSADAPHGSDANASSDGTVSRDSVSRANTTRRPRWFWRFVSFLRSTGRRLGRIMSGRHNG